MNGMAGFGNGMLRILYVLNFFSIAFEKRSSPVGMNLISTCALRMLFNMFCGILLFLWQNLRYKVSQDGDQRLLWILKIFMGKIGIHSFFPQIISIIFKT
jgi:hypothetical protein